MWTLRTMPGHDPMLLPLPSTKGWCERQTGFDVSRQPLFEELRTAGRVTEIFVGGWIDQDQFDLDLPTEFLQACGMLGLSISICTND